MAYVTAVTDRTAADIAARNSKAFFNVATWTRIYGNAELVIGLAWAAGYDAEWQPITTTPTITSIPAVTDFNTLTENIETFRGVMNSFVSDIDSPIKYDYIAGASQQTFDYTDVNLWELTLDLIWEFLDGPLLEVCPTLIANLTVLTGVNKIYIDCLDAATFDIDLQGTANLYIL